MPDGHQRGEYQHISDYISRIFPFPPPVQWWIGPAGEVALFRIHGCISGFWLVVCRPGRRQVGGSEAHRVCPFMDGKAPRALIVDALLAGFVVSAIAEDLGDAPPGDKLGVVEVAKANLMGVNFREAG